MPKPDFICIGIGAQRCGTTWLHKALQKHPDVSMTIYGDDDFNKELHYFDNRVLDYDLSWYESCFTRKGVAGEITPAYSILSYKMVDLISKYLPECKILFVVRNPVDRISSQLKMMTSKWASSTPSRLSLAELVLLFDSPAVVLRSNYLRSFQIWSRCFGLERLLVVDFMELHAASGLQKVLSFINVSKDWHPPVTLTQPILPSPKVDLPAELHWLIADRWLEMYSNFVSLGYGSSQWLNQMREDQRVIPDSFKTKIKLIRRQQQMVRRSRWRSAVNRDRNLRQSMNKRLFEAGIFSVE